MDIPEHIGYFRKVLHVGCGHPESARTHPLFSTGDWREIRLDIDPKAEPDIVADMMAMPQVETAAMDAVFSSHNLEHLCFHEVPLALREFWRVLKPGGFILVAVPDLERVAQWILEGKFETLIARTPLGPIAPIDICFGNRNSMAKGHPFMLHKTGFTTKTLGQRLAACGFDQVKVQRHNLELVAYAIKPSPGVRTTSTSING